jgi:uncharacterized protein YcfJ
MSRAASRVRGKLEEHKDVGYSALGALAGALIGHHVGKGRGKGNAGLLAGAALGGLGANLLERRHEKEKKRKEKVRYDDGYYSE